VIVATVTNWGWAVRVGDSRQIPAGMGR